MPNTYGITKRHIKRAQLLCEHIVEHLDPVYETYTDDHPKFGEQVLAAARFAKELQAYLDEVLNVFVSL